MKRVPSELLDDESIAKRFHVYRSLSWVDIPAELYPLMLPKHLLERNMDVFFVLSRVSKSMRSILMSLGEDFSDLLDRLHYLGLQLQMTAAMLTRGSIQLYTYFKEMGVLRYRNGYRRLAAVSGNLEFLRHIDELHSNSGEANYNGYAAALNKGNVEMLDYLFQTNTDESIRDIYEGLNSINCTAKELRRCLSWISRRISSEAEKVESLWNIPLYFHGRRDLFSFLELHRYSHLSLVHEKYILRHAVKTWSSVPSFLKGVLKYILGRSTDNVVSLLDYYLKIFKKLNAPEMVARITNIATYQTNIGLCFVIDTQRQCFTNLEYSPEFKFILLRTLLKTGNIEILRLLCNNDTYRRLYLPKPTFAFGGRLALKHIYSFNREDAQSVFGFDLEKYYESTVGAMKDWNFKNNPKDDSLLGKWFPQSSMRIVNTQYVRNIVERFLEKNSKIIGEQAINLNESTRQRISNLTKLAVKFTLLTPLQTFTLILRTYTSEDLETIYRKGEPFPQYQGMSGWAFLMYQAWSEYKLDTLDWIWKNIFINHENRVILKDILKKHDITIPSLNIPNDSEGWDINALLAWHRRNPEFIVPSDCYVSTIKVDSLNLSNIRLFKQFAIQAFIGTRNSTECIRISPTPMFIPKTPGNRNIGRPLFLDLDGAISWQTLTAIQYLYDTDPNFWGNLFDVFLTRAVGRERRSIPYIGCDLILHLLKQSGK